MKNRTLLLSTLAVLGTQLTPSILGQAQISGRTDDRALPGTLSDEDLAAILDADGAHVPFVPEAPLGITGDLGQYIPDDNPVTPAKVELGRQLYFDKRLSRDNTISCATCHDPAKGWADAAPNSTGIDGQRGGRSAPTVINRLLGATQFWDGRAATLEEQALGPIGNPIEMGFTVKEAVERLEQVPGYVKQFDAVFGGPPSSAGIAKAIATFERTILSGANKNDYYEAAVPFFDYEIDGSETPEFLERMNTALDAEAAHRMTVAAERGRELFFGKASCSACHVGSDLTDELFHNIGVAYAESDGRVVVTSETAHAGAFKTPTVRNIALTAPYMHDGSQSTLMDVVNHYDQGGVKNPHLSDKIFALKLTEQEKGDLVLFMEEALTGTITEVSVPKLP